MNKKAQVFTLIVAIMTTIALFIIFRDFNFKFSGEDFNGAQGTIGTYSSALINTYQEQESRLLFLDQITKISGNKALLEIANNGGLKTSLCGRKTYNLWNNKDKKCFPTQEETILQKFEENLHKQIDNHKNTISFNKDFELNLETDKKTKFIGTANKKTKLPIKASSEDELKPCTLITGEPSITLEDIKKELQEKNSPALPDAETFLKKGKESGIDPVFALAFFNKESQLGTKGVAVRTKNIGNKRVPKNCEFNKQDCETKGGKQCTVTCSNNDCDFVDCNSDTGCFCGYNTWKKGINEWFDLIKNVYVEEEMDTVETIIPIYAPSEDNNDVLQYIRNVKSFAREYKEVPCKSVIGEYSYRESFNTQIDYDLSIYDELKIFAEEVINECDDNVIDCLENKRQKFNEKNDVKIQYLSDCEEGAEKVFYDFVENLDDCTYSWGDNCKCQITEEYTQEKNDDIKGEYEIQFKKQNKVQPIDSDRQLSFLITLNRLTSVSSEFSIKDLNFWNPSIYNFEYDEELKSNEIIFYDALSGNVHNPKDFKNLFMIKNDNDFSMWMEYEDGLKNTLKREINPPKDCTIAKQTFNLCANTKHELPLLTDDGLKKEFSYEESKIKFGLTIIDKKAPTKINDLKIDKVETLLDSMFEGTFTGTLFKEDISLTWWHENIKDMVLYEIYYSTNSFTNIYQATKLGEFYLNEVELAPGSYDSPDYESMQTNTLYYNNRSFSQNQNFAEKNYYLRIDQDEMELTNENEAQIYFAVVGIDNFQNKQTIVTPVMFQE